MKPIKNVRAGFFMLCMHCRESEREIVCVCTYMPNTVKGKD